MDVLREFRLKKVRQLKKDLENAAKNYQGILRLQAEGFKVEPNEYNLGYLGLNIKMTDLPKLYKAIGPV